MTEGDEDIEGAPKIFRHPKGGALKKLGVGGGRKICILQNQQERGAHLNN